jgi:hypothetical protein
LFVVVPWMKVSVATLPGVKLNPLTVIDPVLTAMWFEDRARLRGAWVGVAVGRPVGEAVGEGDAPGVGLVSSAITWRVAEP